MSDDSEQTAGRILKFANAELSRLPEQVHESALQRITAEMKTWLETVQAGRNRQQPENTSMLAAFALDDFHAAAKRLELAAGTLRRAGIGQWADRADQLRGMILSAASEVRFSQPEPPVPTQP